MRRTLQTWHHLKRLSWTSCNRDLPTLTKFQPLLFFLLHFVTLDPRFKNRNVVFHRYPPLASAQNRALLAAVQSMIDAAQAAQPRAPPAAPAPGIVHALDNFDPAHTNMMQCQRAGMQASQLLVNQIPVMPLSEAPLPRPETFIATHRTAPCSYDQYSGTLYKTSTKNQNCK
jgi:hypothetical protein